jgi:hypothetical protein
MLIARIVNSNSHVDYVARIVDEFDANEPPSAGDYGFGTFVSIPAVEGDEAVGVIYNTMIVNPEYASYGPRLSPKPDLGNFTPDYLNEQGVLAGLLLLGTLSGNGSASQELPASPLTAGDPVNSLPDEAFRAFHLGGDGKIALGYYSRVIAHTGQFAFPLLERILGRLQEIAGEDDAKRIEVLKQNLSWQRTVGAARL